MAAVLRKHDIEAALYAEKQDIAAGRLKEDSPLDYSVGFMKLCEACRRGDIKVCQEQISKGVNINARDRFDYTPLILASLCGHFEVVRLLLESGALCERDTFQGERTLYNALNNCIRNLLLSYDYSKSSDPLQPLAGHITLLLNREHPNTSDLSIVTEGREFKVHKFILSARSPYFAKKLAAAPETTTWRLPSFISQESFLVAIKYLYLSELSTDLGASSDEEAEAILIGIDKLSKYLEIDGLFDFVLEKDRRQARQKRQDEVAKGRDQLERWFRDNVLNFRVHIDAERADDVRWDRSNAIFADVLLRADEDGESDGESDGDEPSHASDLLDRAETQRHATLPIGTFTRSRSVSRNRSKRKSTLYACHRAMLTRSEYFLTMFSSSFREAQTHAHLPVIPVSCTPEVLEIVLSYLYTEKADFGLAVAIDVLFVADLLWLDKLKVRAALVISTLGNGGGAVVASDKSRGGGEAAEDDVVDVYEVVRAGWDTRMRRLEEFGARYIAQRLERYIDEAEFAELVRDSAGRIKERQETDTVELVDDIRYYLSERFRLRFEDAGLEELLEEVSVPRPPDSAAIVGGAPDSEAMGVVRTLDGEEIYDEFAQDAMNYQILLGKIDGLLERLKLDA